jgi:hypothetical protein
MITQISKQGKNSDLKISLSIFAREGRNGNISVLSHFENKLLSWEVIVNWDELPFRRNYPFGITFQDE